MEVRKTQDEVNNNYVLKPNELSVYQTNNLFGW